MDVLAVGENGFGTYRLERSKGPANLVRSDGRAEAVLAPGFVDIHIHGAFGIDFMSANAADMIRLSDMLADQGYEYYLPTTVTASAQAVGQALANLSDHRLIAGFHLEGPFISGAHPGAQPPEFILDCSRLRDWEPILTDPRLRVITLAPEVPGANALIRELSDRGVIVSLGHSDGTFEEAADARAAGARHVTHTFNAMRRFHHREAGLAGFAMLQDGIATELIYDRLHVTRPAAELLIKSKPADKLIGVSDSSMATGLDPGLALTMWGHECVTAPGEVRLAKTGVLAGSAITLREAFRNLLQDFGAETAIRACCLNPRKALGLTPAKKWLLFSLQGELEEQIAVEE